MSDLLNGAEDDDAIERDTGVESAARAPEEKLATQDKPEAFNEALVEDLTKKAHDLDAVRKSVEDAASVSGGLWLSYLFTLFYIGLAAAGVTHSDLLLDKAVNLPFLNVELPLVAFFALAPFLFIISHAYTLMHFVLLAAKVGYFNIELEKKVPDPDSAPTQEIGADRAAELRETRLGLRRQLPSNIFVQLLAGPRDIRDGGLGWLLLSVAWISLVLGPLLLLLLLQIQFLPYHHWWITWVQRIGILADVALLLFLWPAVLASRSEIRWPRLWRHPVLTLASLTSIGLAFTAATFPGEWLDEYVGKKTWIPLNAVTAWLGAKDQTSFHNLLFHGEMDLINRRRRSVFSNTLVLPRFDARAGTKIDDPKSFETVPHNLSLWRRNLDEAILDGADLRKVDLVRASLQRASLDNANLQGALLDDSNLQGASLDGTQLQGASLVQAQLQGALLSHARLQGASLDQAQLQGALLARAQLQGASLDDAYLQDASLAFAELQGTMLTRAKLQGADFGFARLVGVDMKSANIWRANFVESHLEKIFNHSFSEAPLSRAEFAALKNQISASLVGVDIKSDYRRANRDESQLDTIPKGDLPTNSIVSNSVSSSSDVLLALVAAGSYFFLAKELHVNTC